MSEFDSYDLEDLYDAEIAPLMAEIIEICKKNKLPMMATFCYRRAGEYDDRDSYCTTSIPADGRAPARLNKIVNYLYKSGSEISESIDA